jgi:hypothetical protein
MKSAHTNYMELSLSWEDASYSAVQKPPNILWNPEGLLQCSQEPSTGPFRNPDQSSQFNPILSTHIHPGLPGGLFPSGFPYNNPYAFLVIIRATFSGNLILLDLFILIILREEYKLCSSSLRSFIQLSVTPSLFGPNILLSTLFSYTLHKYQRPSFTPKT